MDARFESARAAFLQGLAHYQAGRFEAAEREFAGSLALVPGRVSTLTNLGATRLKLGRPQDALEVLQQALAQDADNAEALGHLATALAELDRPAEALAAVGRALQLDTAAGAAWLLQATLLREQGRREEAAASYREALARGADPQVARYCLAALSGEPAPPAPPRHYVEQLFDAYAEGFDAHLVEALQYRAPAILVDGLDRSSFAAALDLGCGTGLCGPLLRPRVQRLVGVDLSANMVDQARRRGAYDQVVQADVAEHLARTPERYELLIAADVFIYVGALDAVFAGAARVLQPGGVFCFSAEAADGQDDLVLRASLRYAHSERYIRMLAGQHGFAVRHVARHPLRIDQGRPVAGLFAWLVLRGPAG
ncbi:MAG TPA: methyltransferase domain-containing protein [Ramlibacter sp.]|uniref:methyltransferase domain-containing protein n=1 Tax=Ramlibacter sp. TaxID=1917967 RepID=UPI002D61299F|nr:methyltransferase domain-containing protein [Ramlibacter sp.]HZY16931.1 methyltransferase domain-containing protein [Ramlibacter sp.]